SSHVDRSASADDSEPCIKSLIENLKNVIMKKLSVLCIIRSSASLSVSSAAASQSSTSVSVSSSPASATSVSVILTSVTSDFAVSAFVTSSSHFKKMLYRLNKLHLSFLVTLILEVILIKDDNTAETTFFCSQTSLIAFSFFSAEKIVHTSDYKYLILNDF
ncbi:hypothetical protein BDDG_11755, partial [Blastomyces dermatitidis ATCC 18188]